MISAAKEFVSDLIEGLKEIWSELNLGKRILSSTVFLLVITFMFIGMWSGTMATVPPERAIERAERNGMVELVSTEPLAWRSCRLTRMGNGALAYGQEVTGLDESGSVRKWDVCCSFVLCRTSESGQ